MIERIVSYVVIAGILITYITNKYLGIVSIALIIFISIELILKILFFTNHQKKDKNEKHNEKCETKK